MRRNPLILILVGILFGSSSCVLATVRPLEEDNEAKAGFNSEAYVNEIWDSQLIPTVNENAVEVTALLSDLNTDQAGTTQLHGKRSGTGAYSFLIYGDAQVLEVDRESRIGLMSLDFPPYDGESDANMAIGPVIRNRNNAILDAVGFIQFNDFVNQTEFANVGSAIKDRILRDVISMLDLDNLKDKHIHFYGAFTLDDLSNIEIVPITLEVSN